jgi:hypothetical protein
MPISLSLLVIALFPNRMHDLYVPASALWPMATLSFFMFFIRALLPMAMLLFPL